MFKKFPNIPPEALRERVENSPLPPNVSALFTETVSRHGGQLAWHFIDDGISRTWAEVHSAVELIAASFHKVGIKKGSHVGVFLPNIEEFPLTWLALLRLGAVMVPINVTYTGREVAYVIENSQASHLIIHKTLLPLFEELAANVIDRNNVIVVGAAAGFGHQWSALLDRGRGRSAPVVHVDLDDLANIQYTSGTTGFSKGCMLSHRYWLEVANGTFSMFSAPIKRFYAGSSWYYMVPQRILLNAMLAGGGSIHSPRRPAVKRFLDDVRRERCEYMAVFGAVDKQPLHQDDGVNNLKIANIFGLAKENHASFQRRFNVLAQEMYGLTETGTGTHIPVHMIEEMTGSGSCGIDSPFRATRLVGDDDQDVSNGTGGEILIKGAGLFQGYYNNAEATKNAFLGSWFRTGDIGRRDANGYLYLVGRIKEMVRRSGENIASNEVEYVLRAMPEIEEAAIIPVPDDIRGEEVKAYIQLMPGLTPEQVPPERIIEHCSGQLAPFKVPRYIEYRADFPRTDSARVKKKVLTSEKPDLRSDSYDRLEKRWR